MTIHIPVCVHYSMTHAFCVPCVVIPGMSVSLFHHMASDWLFVLVRLWER